MSQEPPYTLTIHLVSGQTVTFPCKTYEFVTEHDEHGNHVQRLDYTPVDDYTETLAMVNFNAIAAVMVRRSPAQVEADRAADAEDD